MTQTEQIETYKYRTHLVVLGIILAVGLAPLLFYWLFYGQVTMVTPIEAKKLLRMPNSPAILVDTSPCDEFNSIHIDGAQNWPAAEILAVDSRDEVPKQFRDKTLLLMCNVGIASTSAAKYLIGMGLEKVMNVRGGTQEWIASVAGPKGDVFDRWIKESGEIVEFPFRQSPWHEQLLIVMGAFPIKISYTVLSLVPAIILWRSKSPELAALRWAMIFFFVGENWVCFTFVGIKIALHNRKKQMF